VIAPHAKAKLFVTATPEVRAQRRFDQLVKEGAHVQYAHILNDIRIRDERDSGRSAAPLKRADDADLLDTTEMSIDGSVRQAIALVEARIKP